MSALQITITQAGYAALINAQHTGTDAVLVNRIGVTEQAFESSDAAAAAMTSLPGELKQLSTFAGDAVADDTIHVTIRDDGPDTYTLRGFGLYLADGTLLAVYGQSETILEKSAQAMLLLAADIRFTNVDTTALEFGDTNWINPPATTQTPGVVQLATPVQAAAGADGTRAMTPATHKAATDARFGGGTPSTFVKGLLSITSAALLRTALAIKGAALKDEGAGNGLDADLLDGQHGTYYLAWGNQTGLPSSFPPTSHTHSWGDIRGTPTTATRWPTYNEVTSKPASFPPASHTHSASDINSGTLAAARIPPLDISKVTGLQNALNGKAALSHTHAAGDINSGTFAAARIPNLDANKIRSGVLDAARIPATMLGKTFTTSVVIQAGSNANRELLFMDGSGAVAGFRGNTGRGLDISGEGGAIRLRPIGLSSATGELRLDTAGNVVASGSVYAMNFLYGHGGRIYGNNTAGGDTHIVNGNATGDVIIRPRGWVIAGQTVFRNNGSVDFPGAINPAGGYDYGSSIKLKTIDGGLPYGLSEVEQMQTAIGRYLPEYNDDGRSRLFFVAEQLAELVPEAVDTGGVEFNGERVPSIKVEQLLPVFANAIKELSAEVRRLRAQVISTPGVF